MQINDINDVCNAIQAMVTLKKYDTEEFRKCKQKLKLYIDNSKFILFGKAEKFVRKVIAQPETYAMETIYLSEALEYILNKEKMPKKFHDFELHGLDKQHKGYRHFHVNGDISMIYKISNDKIQLITIDAHKNVEKNKNKYPVYS